MKLAVVQRILGLLLMSFSVSMLPPIGVSVYFDDGSAYAFSDSFLMLAAAGFLLWWPVRKQRREMRLRDGFMVVALFWLGLGFAGAMPLLLARPPNMSLTDAVFEAVSGFTTTGASV